MRFKRGTKELPNAKKKKNHVRRKRHEIRIRGQDCYLKNNLYPINTRRGMCVLFLICSTSRFQFVHVYNIYKTCVCLYFFRAVRGGRCCASSARGIWNYRGRPALCGLCYLRREIFFYTTHNTHIQHIQHTHVYTMCVCVIRGLLVETRAERRRRRRRRTQRANTGADRSINIKS